MYRLKHTITVLQKYIPSTPISSLISIHRYGFSDDNTNEQTKNLYHNDLVHSFSESWQQNVDTRKKLRGDVIDRVRVSDYGTDKDIRDMILKIQDPTKMIEYITNSSNNIKSVQTYGIAMAKCKKNKDWKSVRIIMDLLLSNNKVNPQCIQFNQLIDCMAHADLPHTCIEYFDLMTNKYGIKPTNFTFATLIKSFRRQALYELAEKYFQCMIHKWNIEPHDSIYCEMMCVYGTAHQTKKATDLFNKHRLQLSTGNTYNLPITTAYLNVFSKSGDLNGMEKVIELMKNVGCELNIVIMSSIITGYQRKRRYKKSLQVLYEWTRNKMNKPDQTLLYRKCVALSTLIADGSMSLDKRHKLFKQLQKTMYIESKQLCFQPDAKYFLLELEGAIFLYRDQNPMKIVEIFESLLNRKLIGYQKRYGENIDIELHMFQKWHAQFILRYLFGLKITEIMNILNQNKLFIVVGKGKHAKGKTNQSGQMKQFVINELKSWNPPIHCQEHKINAGLIWIDKDELIPYLNDHNNYAKQKLSVGSDDWCKIEV
eukprot:427176_1